MKKLLVVTLSVTLMAGALTGPAEAGKKKKKKKPKKVERTATSSYDAPALGSGGGVCLGATNSCGNLAIGPEELYVMVSIDDAAGVDVFTTVGQDLDGDSFTDTAYDICGASTEPIALEPGYPVTIFPWAAGSPDCPGVATQGTVTATFSNLP